MLYRWLDAWTGIGLMAVGIERQGYRLSLSHIAEGEYRATFEASDVQAGEVWGGGDAVERGAAGGVGGGKKRSAWTAA